MISAEDLVATKILAGRRKDLEDARGVLLERAEGLDLELVRRVITRLDAALGGDKLGRRLARLIRTVQSYPKVGKRVQKASSPRRRS